MCETSWPSFSVSARIANHSGSATKAFHFSFAIGKAFPFQDVIQIVVTVTNQGRPEADRAKLEFVLPQLQRVVHETGIQARQPLNTLKASALLSACAFHLCRHSNWRVNYVMVFQTAAMRFRKYLRVSLRHCR